MIPLRNKHYEYFISFSLYSYSIYNEIFKSISFQNLTKYSLSDYNWPVFVPLDWDAQVYSEMISQNTVSPCVCFGVYASSHSCYS